MADILTLPQEARSRIAVELERRREPKMGRRKFKRDRHKRIKVAFFR